ncbi:hypothetical protein L202_01601 [Cryptococcus amylolentus CBS 6039]|uniref:Elongation factor methyltransferase 7 n=2 Tax=Cryptococcus amylolentus TaxID=104669 RepID=A0A1E3I4A4_9TREE|nr:hypothetical protein L202_01601 [Cryptococcus amylolentus CBS 6039]ODN83464.1 hypothetical protein L202_01601 [Cryptococcus amylolentus CBS 6039]ODO10984.1 hypothetical protein I350_01584 [Cryptococcus amylolentus CBS 6273]
MAQERSGTPEQEDDEEFFGLDDLMPEPESPVPAPFSFAAYEIPDGLLPSLPKHRRQMILRLVGSHPLWGHHLWNTARTFSTYLLSNPALTSSRNILELGAGAGLPSIVSCLPGADAQKVVVTDYSDEGLLENLRFNVEVDLEAEERERCVVDGHVWGHKVGHLLDHLPQRQMFDLLILSDLVFNHSQHDALIKTVESTLAPAPSTPSDPTTSAPLTHPSILVFFTHHRPHLAHADLAFFPRLAESGGGWVYEKVVDEWAGAMFENDPGDERVRGTVHGWRCWRVRDGEEKGERESAVTK